MKCLASNEGIKNERESTLTNFKEIIGGWESNIELYCDFHGHSNSFNLFIYGCKGPLTKDILEIKEFPDILEKISKE